MRVLVDTNVICRLAQPRHTLNPISLSATRHLLADGHDLRVVPQVLYEFWAIATRSIEENGLGFSVTQTQKELSRVKLIFPPLRDERGILEPWESLVVAHAVRGKSTHDARLVAAMRRHGITKLLTFDGNDFVRYPAIDVLDPNVVAKK